MARKIAVPKDFQVGDIVLVESSGARFRKNAKWQGAWTPSMEQAVGNCFTVMRENIGNGVGLAFKDAIWGFPEKSLRLIKRGKMGYFRKGDKVLIACHVENTSPRWDAEPMDKTIGEICTVSSDYNDSPKHDVRLQTSTGLWYYGVDCIELYTGQVPDEQPQPPKEFIINEPLQDYERF